jgi:microcystin-dependent protein
MSDLIRTNLVLVAAPLPADFKGNPQDLFEAFVERVEIQSPVGTNFFVSGDVMPSSNQGPWLRGETQWWVFDANAGTYVPLDITESISKLFVVSSIEPQAPGADDAQIWLRTANGRVIGWYFWTGLVWRPGGNATASGSTAERPAEPGDFEQFYDTDINTLIHWERGAWRTVSGVPRDVKFVVTPTLADALTQNPGWVYLGSLDQSFIGTVLGVAAKDPGATPDANFATDSGITPQAPGDIVGEETHVLTSDELEQHTHMVGALITLTHDNKLYFYRVDNGDDISAPAPRPPNYAQINGAAPVANSGFQIGELPATPAGTMLVTSRQLSISEAPAYTGAAQGHNNMQPTLFLWALTKQ